MIRIGHNFINVGLHKCTEFGCVSLHILIIFYKVQIVFKL